MNDPIQRITSLYDTLTPSQRQAADHIMAHFPEAIQNDIHTLSVSSGVSEATLIRFCRKLGFRGYRDFCLGMAEGMREQVDYVTELPREGESVEGRISGVLLAEAETIRMTLTAMDYNALRIAAEHICKARELLFIGQGTSQIVAQDAALRFLRGGRLAVCHADPHAGVVAASLLDGRDVAVGISHSGGTKEVLEMLELARRNGAYTVGITTYPGGPMGELCDVILPTVTRESPNHKVAFTSRVSQLALIDALFMASLMGDGGEMKREVMQVSDNIRRLHPKN